MAAVWYRARAELRRRWRATVALTLLVGLAGAVVLTVVAGARRSSSAYDRFREASRSANVTLITSDPSRLDQVERLPQVEAVGRIFAPLFAPLRAGAREPEFVAAASPDGSFAASVDRLRVMRGRALDPDKADELVVSEEVGTTLGLAVGQDVTFRFFAPEQLETMGADATPEPAGPSVTVKVVGIIRSPQNLAPGASGIPAAYLTPAFYRAYGDSIAAYPLTFSRVRLGRGQADLPAFSEAAGRIYGDDPEFVISPPSIELATVQDAIDIIVIGLLVFAAVGATAGLVAVGQALSRHLSHDAASRPVLSALGMTRPQRTGAAALAVAPVAVGGALLAAVGAVLASPLMPISLARRAEPDPGLSFDPIVIGLGLLTVALAVSAMAAAAAWWSTRVDSVMEGAAPSGRARPSAVARALAAAGLPPPVTAGARMAFEPGRGRTAVPVRSGLAGAVLGLASLVAVVVFAASLTALEHTPARYGWNWDANVPGSGPSGSDDSAVESHAADLAADPAVADLAAVRISHAQMAGSYLHVLGFSALKGAVTPTVIEGRAAHGPDEVVLGTETLRRVGASLGDHIEAPGVERPLELRIVGRAAIPNLDTDAVADDGALMTRQGVDRLVTTESHVELVLNWATGTDKEAARRDLEQRVGTVIADKPPSDVVNLARIQAIPRLLAVFLALLALMAVGHALVVTVRRRGRDLAVLKALGFQRRQVSATVAWQASLFALVGLALGLPLGVAAGRWAWALVANSVGVVTRPEVPLVALALLGPAALAVANIIAALPAWAAARTQPAHVLRTE
ncbi:MAG: ABC transporter permease [Actinomycetota bacterium]|nr:ABC transporter permease [Actinomycetota bacterium]MDQ3680956.1 ABC transporter permease [Actinomycetota bacterium]